MAPGDLKHGANFFLFLLEAAGFDVHVALKEVGIIDKLSILTTFIINFI
jgi:hypothetical protein